MTTEAKYTFTDFDKGVENIKNCIDTLKSVTGTKKVYVGITSDVERRVAEHNKDDEKQAANNGGIFKVGTDKNDPIYNVIYCKCEGSKGERDADLAEKVENKIHNLDGGKYKDVTIEGKTPENAQNMGNEYSNKVYVLALK